MLRGLIVIALLGLSVPAYAYSSGVIKFCKNDWLRYCSEHDPNSSYTRNCMRERGYEKRLSKPCIRALIKGGLVTSRDYKMYRKRNVRQKMRSNY